MTRILTVQLIGSERLQQRLEELVTPEKIDEALDRCAHLVENDAKRIVRVDTGALKSSINTLKIPNGRAVGSGKEYAAAQEFGRPDLPQYGYTPFLRPAVRKNMNKMNLIFKELIERQ